MTTLASHPSVEAAPPRRPVHRLRAWPLTGILLLYPLWWALGLGVLIFFLAAVPMLWALVRHRAAGHVVKLPPGFVLWLMFLAVVAFGLFTLGADPAGTVPGTAQSRLVPFAFRLGGYTALTVLLVYAGNIERRVLTQERLVRLLGWLFVITVAGGLLGMAAPRFEFTAPFELLLPGHMRHDAFVQSMVHPTAAQVMNLLGGEAPRPGAPWGYTNTWGNNVCLLAGWLAVAAFAFTRRRWVKVFAVATLLVSLVPIVYSLNRGLWIGLAAMAVYVAVRLALRGKFAALGLIAVAAVTVAVALAVTPLGDVVNARVEHGKSNGVRMYTTQKAIDGMWESPFIGFGSTRNTIGGRNSIAVGESANCARCGNFTIGGGGQLWQLLYAHGLLGTATYLGFFLFGLWRFRRDATPMGLAGGAALVSSFTAMLWYNSLVTPLALTFLAYAVLWRNQQRGISQS
ncbi:O-antigen ligase family protein [Dactylosporangium salmoneum]|uniref:O-antigen ligase-related domain-containing protein n=1 Tax=Dactylosporangium salmoneum TaxID=53361 RepID=A0ABP5V3F2_9ACTN